MKAEILSVGTEILLGDIVDTNAQFLARRLSEMGIDVYFESTVGDNPARLLETFRLALSRADIVLVTGGLGPTMDDLTCACAAQSLGLSLREDERAAREIRARYEKTGQRMPPNALKQALVPENAAVFYNTCGTAPGCAMQKDGKVIVTMPGPPHEMREMFLKSVRPYLKNLPGAATIHSRVLRTFGIGEPALEEKLRDLLTTQTNPTIGIYVGFGQAHVRISAKAASEKEADALIDPVAREIYARLGDLVYAEGETDLDECVARLLMKKKKTIALAESCTGGMIASSLVAFPGISECLLESHVTYSNAAKMRVLGVKEETLVRHGAVSHETAREMAAGLRRESGADMTLSVTGIAGPGGGTREKPVGLVYIGFCDETGVTSREYIFDGERARVRQLSMLNALDTIRRALMKTEEQ